MELLTPLRRELLREIGKSPLEGIETSDLY